MIFAWVSFNGKIFPEKFIEERLQNKLSQKFYADQTLKSVKPSLEEESLSLDELAKLHPLGG